MDINIDINLSENEIIFSDNESESSDDSDEDFDYLSLISNDDKTINSLAEDVIKDLYINNKLNKSKYIQKSTKGENEVKISHIVLNDSQIHEFSDSDNIFESKIKQLEDLERKWIYDENDDKILTKSDVEMNEIPKRFNDFLNVIFELDATLIEDQKSKLYFRQETEYRNIQYNDHNSYVNAFIPFVFRELWNSLKDYRKRQLSTDLMDFKLIEDQFKCFYIRNNSLNESKYKFGQIVVFNYLIDSNNTVNDQNKRQMFFGIVQNIESKLIDKTSDHSYNLSEVQSEENDFILDEITIFCKPLSKSCGKVSVMALNCIQNYLLEARIVYEIKDKFEEHFRQILKPIFTFGVTGISINMETRQNINFFDDQLDSIQKAYEVCCASDSVSSSFVAIYGPTKSGKTEILRETILQLLKYGETKVNKLIVISNSLSEITSIIDQLKRHRIKVYHIDSEGNSVSHNKKEIKDKIIKIKKHNIEFQELIDKDIDSYKQCLKYYNEEIQLTDMSTKEKFIKEKIDKKVICQLISESEVIIGSISSICNDESFNFTYNFVSENVISSLLIDNASIYTEPEILSLLYAGVKGIVLFGNNLENRKSNENRESFLQRYVRLYNNCNSNELKSRSTSVVKLRDSIESRKRYEENLKNRETNRKNINQYNRNNFPHNRGKSTFRYSNSNGFNKHPINRNRSFTNRKYTPNRYSIQPLIHTNQRLPHLQYENVVPIDPNQYIVDMNQYQNNGITTDQQMIDLSQMTAYGNRESYINQNTNPMISNDYNQLSYNIISVPSYGNRTHFMPENNFPLMVNPSLNNNNQNYNSG